MLRLLGTSVMVVALLAGSPTASAGPVATGPTTVGTAPAAAAASTAAAEYDACAEELNPDRRKVYRLKKGTKKLSFGRLVVQATEQFPHRYCVRFQTGGRTVKHAWSMAEHERVDGVCGEQLGAMGSGTYRTGAYTRTIKVAKGICRYEAYQIKHKKRWYTARFMRARG